MTFPARVIGPFGAAAVLVASALLGGCYDQTDQIDISRVRLWIPDASAKAFPLAVESALPRPVEPGLAGSHRELATPIGDPWAERTSFWAWASTSRARVGQPILAKTFDGHFYAATYVWRDDVLLEGCVDSPQRCSGVVDARALGVDEAKALLRGANQFTPKLYEAFFGTAPTREAHA